MFHMQTRELRAALWYNQANYTLVRVTEKQMKQMQTIQIK